MFQLGFLTYRTADSSDLDGKSGQLQGPQSGRQPGKPGWITALLGLGCPTLRKSGVFESPGCHVQTGQLIMTTERITDVAEQLRGARSCLFTNRDKAPGPCLDCKTLNTTTLNEQKTEI